jgi:hypothetical protein
MVKGTYSICPLFNTQVGESVADEDTGGVVNASPSVAPAT